MDSLLTFIEDDEAEAIEGYEPDALAGAERRDFYVYQYVRNGVPVYIGMGKGRRAHKHFKQRTNPHLFNAIQKAERERTALYVGIIEDGLARSQANALEMSLIAQYGRIDLGTGTLFNLCAGGLGSRDPSPAERSAQSARRKAMNATPEHKDHLRRLSATPEHKDHLRRLSATPEAKDQLRKLHAERATNRLQIILDSERHIWAADSIFDAPPQPNEEARPCEEWFANNSISVRWLNGPQGEPSHNNDYNFDPYRFWSRKRKAKLAEEIASFRAGIEAMTTGRPIPNRRKQRKSHGSAPQVPWSPARRAALDRTRAHLRPMKPLEELTK